MREAGNIAEAGKGTEGGGGDGAHFEPPYHNVEKLSDLPSAVGGVRTLLPGVTKVRGTIGLPSGERIFQPANAVLSGWSSAVDGIEGDYDGPLISGADGVVVADLKTKNVNTGANAYDYLLTSLGRTSRIENCSLQGHRCVRVNNHAGLVSLLNSLATGPAPGSGPVMGIVIDGMVAALQAVGWSSGNTTPGFRGVKLEATGVLGLAMLIRDCNAIQALATDRFIQLDNGATVPGMAAIGVLDCAHVGAGALFDESAGHWGPSDIPVMARGSATSRDSTGAADFGFSSTTGQTTTINTVDVWENIKTKGTVTLQVHKTERYTVVDDDPTHGTYAQYTGPLANQPTKATLHVSVERVGGSGNNKYEVRAQRWDGATWAAIPGSEFMVESSGAADPIPMVAETNMNPGDRIRFQIRNRTDADNVRCLSYHAKIAWN